MSVAKRLNQISAASRGKKRVIVEIDGKRKIVEADRDMTNDQIAAELEGQLSPQQDNRPKSFWQGVREELGKAASNAQWVGDILQGRGVVKALTGQPAPSDVTRAQVRNQASNASVRGSTAGRITGGVLGTIPTAMVPGGPFAQGAAAGLLLTEDPNNLKGLARDVAIGGVASKAGDVVGRKVLAPVAERVGRTRPVRAVAEAAARAVNRSPLPLPQITKPERMLSRTAAKAMDDVRTNIDDAARLGLPYSLADADPRLRALGGSVARFSPDARALAERNLAARSAGQADRAVNAIDDLLAPVTDVEKRGAQLLRIGGKKAGPFYRQAFEQPAPIDDELASMLNRPAGKAALAKARQIALNEGRDPDSLGFVLNPEGEVSLAEIVKHEAGRFANAKAPAAERELTRRVFRGTGGREVAKHGPLDLVGWVRLNGGLKDQGGELSHMGLTNAARKMDLVGKETHFGPLVHEQGRNLDDIAQAAWEAGYFPEKMTRPSVNEFLDALRGTHEGWSRRFLPDDFPELDRFYSAIGERNLVKQARFEGSPVIVDRSVSAGQRPFAPVPTESEVRSPTFETLDLIKRGFDETLNDFRNPMTNKLELRGKPLAQSVEALRKQFVGKLDDLDTTGAYREARSQFQNWARRNEALQTGQRLAKNAIPQRQFDRAVSGFTETTLPEAQRGYATSLADIVNKQRLSRNPYSAIYGSPNQQGQVASLFPQGAPRFARQVELEGEMAKTATEALGGSQTQPRAMADALFQSNLANDAADAAIQLTTGGGIPSTTRLLGTLARAVKDRSNLGLLGAKKKADALGPLLFDTSNPRKLADMLDEIARKQAEEELRRKAYQRAGGLLSLPAAAGGIAATSP